ncbi:AT hook domain-containing protein [Histoplasma capsulatum var. duboisii H88]|uniref:AT hook domain-containing protein n=1 Tax=Ajellomyces capsulatus (strain H88) TaxID=544711 RepID=F0U9V5_AJEC8|nr:AT hook domain-containing protein [Histoplasma capsulatum var. duboisii H88]
MSNDTRRILRSAAKQQESISQPSSLRPPLDAPPAPEHPIITILRGSKLPNLSPAECKLFREKQLRLSNDTPHTRASVSGQHLRTALEASLIFAQHEAGSAVCIHPAGWVLTCAHCFGETEEEYLASPKTRWLLFYDGRAVQAECRAWDAKRDLALLKIIAIESDGASAGIGSNSRNNNNRNDHDHDADASFPFVALSDYKPAVHTPIICIGQPGSEDLESATDRKTDYGLVEVSRGAFKGMVPGADPCDNSEIGTLKHDAWTYWGHSGAPLLNTADGSLIGLHSSWDDRTRMRHGVPLVAIEMFLQEHGEVMRAESVGQRVCTILADGKKEVRQRGLVQSLAARPMAGVQAPCENGNADVIVISSDSSDDSHGETL